MRTTTIKDFKKEKVIGKGSFGSVYLVRRIADNKIYALKTVILDKLNKKEQENSVNEVRILASINHPNVIGYKEAFWDDKSSSLNIVMEYANDGDLQSKIIKMRNEGGFFKESIIWEYSIQMIEGLKALHDKKIMHRDLKSANIFLFKENHQCKLGDMNVSKVIKEKVLLTQTGTRTIPPRNYGEMSHIPIKVIYGQLDALFMNYVNYILHLREKIWMSYLKMYVKGPLNE